MFEVIPPSEAPKVIDAAQTGRCVACYADAYGNGLYCPACDPPIQVIADLMEFGAPLQLTAGPRCICGDGPDIWCPRDDHARQAWNTPPRCICRDAYWYPGRPDNPACPVHGHTKPCTCYYGLHSVVGAPGPWEQYRPPGIRRPRWMTRCFVIVWSCPHHGDDAVEPVTGEWDITELVLDEDERRGH